MIIDIPWILWLYNISIFNINIQHINIQHPYIYIPIGSMVLPYMVTWIPSIYPIFVSIYIYTPYMDPMGDIYIYRDVEY